MIKAGDKVRINIGVLEDNDFHEAHRAAMSKYIREHPNEIYTVESVTTPAVLADIKLDHDVLRTTSFFAEELIKVGDSE